MSVHTNITKAEHLELENLWKEKGHIIVTADRSVALVVMDKAMWSSPTRQLSYQHLTEDTSPTIHKELIKILQDYKNNNFISEIE